MEEQFGSDPDYTPRSLIRPEALAADKKNETEDGRLMAVFTRSKSWQRIQEALERAVRPFPEAWRALGLEMRNVCLTLEGAV